MADINAEHNSSAPDPALNGLNAADKAETTAILSELEGESSAAKPAEGDAPAPKPEEKKPEDKPAEGADGKKPEGTDGTGKPAARREVKLMPAWLHERAKDDWQKREGELLKAVEEAKAGAGAAAGAEKPAEGQEQGKEGALTTAEQATAKALAEKHSIAVELAEDIVKLGRGKGDLPADVMEKLKAVDTFREEQAVSTETTRFNGDFDQLVVPLIKQEYGDDVPQAIIDDIREDLKEQAYTPDFAKVPYSVLYKGEDKYRSRVAPKKNGAEGERGAPNAGGHAAAGGEGAIDLTQPQSDEAIKGMTDAQFEEYEKNMAGRERSSNKPQ